MIFTVYKNRVHKYAAVHESSCPRIKVHGGVSSVDPPTGWYVEGLGTLEDAVREAESTGWEVRMCGSCHPGLGSTG